MPDSSTPILAVKLAKPRVNPGVLDRPRIQALLDDRLSHQIATVIAPSGSGKTTSVALWAAARPDESVSWLRLDSGDDDPDRFVRHLVAALRSFGPRIGEELLEEMRRPNRLRAADLGALLAADVADVKQPSWLVIDECDQVGDAWAMTLLAALCVDLPEHVHVVILGQAAPAFDLSSLRMRGLVADIGASDLAFTEDEAIALYDAQPRDYPRADFLQLRSETSGWPTVLALALAGGAVAGRSEDTITSLVLTTIKRQSGLAQNLIWRCSILQEFDAQMAADLLDRDDTMAVERALFDLTQVGLLQVDPATGRMRPSAAIRSSLDRLGVAHLGALRISSLQRRASDLHAARGEIGEAVRLALAGGGVDQATNLVLERVDDMIDREHWTDLATWLDQLPDDAVRMHPQLLLGRCWVAFFRHNYGSLRSMLPDVRTALANPALNPRRVQQWVAELDMLSCALLVQIENEPEVRERHINDILPRIAPDRAYLQGNARFWRGYSLSCAGRRDEAIAWLREEAEQRWQANATTARIHMSLALLGWVGLDTQTMIASAEALIDISERGNLPISLGWGLAFAGYGAYQINDLPRAIEYLSRLPRMSPMAHLNMVTEGMILLAVVFEANGQQAEADATLDRLDEILEGHGSLEGRTAVQVARIRFEVRRRGATPMVRAWLTQAMTISFSRNPLSLSSGMQPVLVIVEALLALGDAGSLLAAEARLDAFAENLAANHILRYQLEVAILRARVAYARGDTARAVELTRALLADPTSLAAPRLVVEIAAPLAAVLSHIAQSGTRESMGAQKVLEFVYESARSGKTRGELSTEDGLTRREQDVINLMVGGLSNKEIAARLFVTEATIKRHAYNAYRKLGVRNRRQAVNLMIRRRG